MSLSYFNYTYIVRSGHKNVCCLFFFSVFITFFFFFFYKITIRKNVSNCNSLLSFSLVIRIANFCIYLSFKNKYCTTKLFIFSSCGIDNTVVTNGIFSFSLVTKYVLPGSINFQELNWGYVELMIKIFIFSKLTKESKTMFFIIF